MIKIFRKRYLPLEVLWLKDDEVLHVDDDIIITKWNSLKPRTDFSHGVSCYFIHNNFRVSKFFDEKGNFLFYYCDIMKSEKHPEGWVFCDMLVDVVVYPDGAMKVIDLDELAEAYYEQAISKEDLLLSLSATDRLLKIIYANNFSELTVKIDTIC